MGNRNTVEKNESEKRDESDMEILSIDGNDLKYNKNISDITIQNDVDTENSMVKCNFSDFHNNFIEKPIIDFINNMDRTHSNTNFDKIDYIELYTDSDNKNYKRIVVCENNKCIDLSSEDIPFDNLLKELSENKSMKGGKFDDFSISSSSSSSSFESSSESSSGSESSSSESSSFEDDSLDKVLEEIPSSKKKSKKSKKKNKISKLNNNEITEDNYLIENSSINSSDLYRIQKNIFEFDSEKKPNKNQYIDSIDGSKITNSTINDDISSSDMDRVERKFNNSESNKKNIFDTEENKILNMNSSLNKKIYKKKPKKNNKYH